MESACWRGGRAERRGFECCLINLEGKLGVSKRFGQRVYLGGDLHDSDDGF